MNKYFISYVFDLHSKMRLCVYGKVAVIAITFIYMQCVRKRYYPPKDVIALYITISDSNIYPEFISSY
jgi:hypothetical protein